MIILGLTYREVLRSMEIEPGNATNALGHLVNSTFDIKELKRIEALLNGLP